MGVCAASWARHVAWDGARWAVDGAGPAPDGPEAPGRPPSRRVPAVGHGTCARVRAVPAALGPWPDRAHIPRRTELSRHRTRSPFEGRPARRQHQHAPRGMPHAAPPCRGDRDPVPGAARPRARHSPRPGTVPSWEACPLDRRPHTGAHELGASGVPPRCSGHLICG